MYHSFRSHPSHSFRSREVLGLVCVDRPFPRFSSRHRKITRRKLALLHRYVRGDCLDVIHGVGGGEGAYIEALVRLKESCGRRDVMRATHIQTIENLELKNDPAILKRYAEKVRTHLFDLSRIGETFSAGLI